jgi:hypothetical protein
MKRLTLVSVFMAGTLLAAALFVPFALRSQAQGDGPLVCDSTLMLLVYIAEHDFDYLSGNRMNDPEAAAIDYGQFTPLIEETVAMMMAMMEAASEEEMAMMEEMEMMVEPMMAMDLQALTNAYLGSMAMDEVDLSTFTQLPSGALEGESEGCTALREDVTQFLLANILTESMMMMEGDGM